MPDTAGHVKREIADLVKRVAYGGERIILTSITGESDERLRRSH